MDELSTPVGTRRPGGRAERVRTGILRATADLLAEVGYDTVSVEAIATRAGVHKTTVYRRWPTLPELVADAMAEHAAQHIPIPDTGSLREDLRQLALSVIANLATEAGNRRAASIVAAASHSPDVAARAHEFWRARMHAASVIVQRAVERGEARADVDPARLIESVVAPIWFRALATGATLDEDLAGELARLAAQRATSPEGSTSSA